MAHAKKSSAAELKMPVELSSIEHVAICVANVKQAVNWYQTSFNCTVVFEDITQALLEFKNIRLALVLPSQQPPHLAFRRKDAETLGTLLKQRDGESSTFLSDPTGNLIEIMTEKVGND